MAAEPAWTTCPDCGSEICPDDCGTTWCQNCGVVELSATETTPNNEENNE